MITFEVEGVGGGESVENEPETVVEQQFQNDFVFDLPKQSITSEADVSIPWGADPFRIGDSNLWRYFYILKDFDQKMRY